MAATTARACGGELRHHPRWRTMLQAWPLSTRALPLATLAAIWTLAAAPALIVLVTGGRELTGALVAATLVVGGGIAFSVDDRAAETLAASPTTLAKRHLVRLSTTVLGAAVILAALWVVADLVGRLPAEAVAQRGAELAATAGISLAVASAGRRQGGASAVQVGAVAGPLSVLFISSLAYRFNQLPAILTIQHHDRWWLIAGAAWAGTAWTWRDPARR